MSLAAVAEQSLKNGDPVGALAQLTQQVRSAPADPKLRVFLFQLLCVLGQWDRALNQLNVASGLDPGALAMAQTYGDAVRCEAIPSPRWLNCRIRCAPHRPILSCASSCFSCCACSGSGSARSTS